MTEQEKLWEVCRKFIEKNEIDCPETIYQCDHVIVNSYGLLEEICKIVGYSEEEEEK